MSCLTPERLELYLEDELSGDERRSVEEHLAACPACRRRLEDLRVFEQAFSTLPEVEIPENFAASVMARLPAKRHPAFGRPSAVVAGVATVLATPLVYYLLTGENLFAVLASAVRALISYLSLAVPFVAKLFKLVAVLFMLAWNFLTALWKGLGLLSSLLKPEVIGLALAFGVAASLLLVFGVKKIASLGEKS